MGSSFLTLDEAASRLGKTKRSVQNYLKQGLLTRVIKDNKVVLRKEEVEQLAIEAGTDMPAINRKTVFQMMARLQKLEEKMTVVQRMLDIRDKVLRPEVDEARGLWAAATASLGSAGNWSLSEVDLWADMFDQFDEITLECIQKAVTDSHPWRPFFELCLGMLKYVTDLNARVPDLAMQSRMQRLDQGRKKIRSVIIMWVEMGRGTVPESFLNATDEARDALLRRLASGNGKSR